MMDPLDHIAAEAARNTGRRVECWRQRAGWTVDELAARTKIPVESLIAMERGTGDVRLAELARLAVVFGTPVSALVQ